MATSYLRHQLYLHGSKITRLALVALAVVGLASSGHAQEKSRTKSSRSKSGHVKSITTDNLPGYDDKWFHPGFYIAPNFSRYRIEQSPSYIQAINSGQGISANALSSPGFSVGFVGDVRIADFLSLRFTPGVSFLSRRIEFKPQGYSGQDTIVNQEVGSTQIDLPLLFKFKSQRRRNTRVYVVGGIKPSFNVGNRRKDPELFKLRAADSDLAIEYGVGLDLFYPLFKFAPELRFSNGLRNLLIPSNDIYSRSLQRLTSNTVTLYLTFE
ncbi:type IX secretion/gliding motility protein PorT/SprT [Hymenobacter cavernae]|uniref:type IX secretion/gliding motility protein PorT/SprT n=1 Tax=Hymenobacter cavernae TaxID=2044852 RepID=UPI00166538A0|nr:porin family protein [Hymenobacter cavernae]